MHDIILVYKADGEDIVMRDCHCALADLVDDCCDEIKFEMRHDFKPKGFEIDISHRAHAQMHPSVVKAKKKRVLCINNKISKLQRDIEVLKAQLEAQISLKQSCVADVCQYHVNTLPNDLLYAIFSFLDPVTIVIASRVCKRWYSSGNCNRLWREICAPVFDNNSILRGDLSNSDVKDIIGLSSLPEDWFRINIQAVPQVMYKHLFIGRMKQYIEKIQYRDELPISLPFEKLPYSIADTLRSFLTEIFDFEATEMEYETNFYKEAITCLYNGSRFYWPLCYIDKFKMDKSIICVPAATQAAIKKILYWSRWIQRSYKQMGTVHFLPDTTHQTP